MPAPPSTALTDTLEAADEQIRGQTALVTGAAQGIGRGVAERLASEGASLVLLDIEPEALERTVRELRAKASRVEAVSGDVAERADVRRAVELAVERFGGLDILAGIAGITSSRPCSSWATSPGGASSTSTSPMFIATQEAAGSWRRAAAARSI